MKTFFPLLLLASTSLVVSSEESHASRFRRVSKSKSKSKSKGSLMTDSSWDDAQVLCRMLKAFELSGQYENNEKENEGRLWHELCDDFDSLDIFLCPNQSQVSNICSYEKDNFNRAVKEHYCQPLFEGLQEEEASSCIKYCGNYVGRANCCDFECSYGS
jgi:hypothetical protein